MRFIQRNPEPQLAERFTNKRENIKPVSWFKALFGCVRPAPDKTVKKAEKHSKEGPIRVTVGKSGFFQL